MALKRFPVFLLVLVALVAVSVAEEAVKEEEGVKDIFKPLPFTDSECFIEEYAGLVGGMYDTEEFDRAKAKAIISDYLGPTGLKTEVAKLLYVSMKELVPILALEPVSEDTFNAFEATLKRKCNGARRLQEEETEAVEEETVSEVNEVAEVFEGGEEAVPEEVEAEEHAVEEEVTDEESTEEGEAAPAAEQRESIKDRMTPENLREVYDYLMSSGNAEVVNFLTENIGGSPNFENVIVSGNSGGNRLRSNKSPEAIVGTRDCEFLTAMDDRCYVIFYAGFVGNTWGTREFDEMKATYLVDTFVPLPKLVATVAGLLCTSADTIMPVFAGETPITPADVDGFHKNLVDNCVCGGNGCPNVI